MSKRPTTVVRERMRVSLAPKLRSSNYKVESEPYYPVETPSQARLRIAHEQRLREEQNLASRNRDITRLEDPLADIDISALVTTFASKKKRFAELLTTHLLKETASLASIQDVGTVLGNVVGSSADFDDVITSQHVQQVFELRFLELLTKTVGVSPKIREHMLRRYVDREWGPRLVDSRPVVVKVGQNTPNSGSAGKAPSKRSSKSKPSTGQPGVAASRGSFNPFGKI